MIIVKLTGGLGNQMFQYAAGKSLSKHLNAELKLDLSYFRYEKIRNYELHSLNINENFASIKEVFALLGCRFYYEFDKLYKTNYFYRNIRKKKHFYWPTGFDFDENFYKVTAPVYIEGYWQSEKYFLNVKDDLKEEFRIKKELGPEMLEIKSKIENSLSVGIHIRRSDYFYSHQLYKLHGLLRNDYYEKAISLLAEKFRDICLFVFTDDIVWAKQMLIFDCPTVFVQEVAPDTTAAEEMMLMSLCKHNVIANSSFSWWGAWLNRNPDKVVVAPVNWFKNKDINTDDVIPAGWIRI